MIIDVLSWVITGLIVGALARFFMPGRQPMSLLGTIALGIVGAFLGGLIVSLLTGGFNRAPDDVNGWYWPGWIMSVVGGVAVLWAYLALTRTDTTARRPV
jgi:uncharacterized membrane protein YeaQ/YmgE (transglycosylase-associated protein family)